MLQKYSFICCAYCDVYRGHEYIETLFELLKFSENSPVFSTSTKTFQQEQEKHLSVRVSSATHCDKQSHQQRPALCYIIEPGVNRAVLERVVNFILLCFQNHSDNYSSRTEGFMYPWLFPQLCRTDANIKFCGLKIGLLSHIHSFFAKLRKIGNDRSPGAVAFIKRTIIVLRVWDSAIHTLFNWCMSNVLRMNPDFSRKIFVGVYYVNIFAETHFLVWIMYKIIFFPNQLLQSTTNIINI